MLDALKEQVLKANLLLPRHQLVTFTWGNVSGIDRESGLVVIKPSGLPYEEMRAEDMTVVDLDGKKVEGRRNPSTDTATHLELYRAFPQCGGIVHTHSKWATVFAQLGLDLLPFGTTHADDFHGAIPCTRPLTPEEIAGNYEQETGKVIVETMRQRNPAEVPAALVFAHGPFVWGENALQAVQHAVVLEEIAFLNWHTLRIDPKRTCISQELLDKHYFRKHGEKAYYGQS